MVRIVPIVEGHGEVQAVPVLIRRIAADAAPGVFVHVVKPLRVPRQRILKQGQLEEALRIAAIESGSDGRILMLLDANGDCPRELAPNLLARARATRSDRRIQVVLANSEYEAWFLAAAGSIAGFRGIDDDALAPDDPESIRDAKGWLTQRMAPGRSYRDVRDQAAFTARMDLQQARLRAPSFDKMWRAVENLLR